MTLELSITERPVRREHTYEKHEHCTQDHCNICDGGLSVCVVCGGMEGALLDGCPGVRLTMEQHEWNYRGYRYRDQVVARARARGRRR